MIDKLRKEIDRIDDHILMWLNKRIEKAILLGRLKQEAGISLYVPEREEEIIQRLINKNDKHYLPNDYLKEIYSKIIEVSLYCQKKFLLSKETLQYKTLKDSNIK